MTTLVERLRSTAKWCADEYKFLSSPAGQLHGFLNEAADKIDGLEARIDELMLEHCPDEMTQEQKDNWAKHQRAVSPSEQERIDTAIKMGVPWPFGPKLDGCTCEACMPQGNLLDGGSMRFIVCSICGNKRCPHATDHSNPCTNSNESGQKGSSWEHIRPPGEKP